MEHLLKLLITAFIKAHEMPVTTTDGRGFFFTDTIFVVKVSRMKFNSLIMDNEVCAVVKNYATGIILFVKES
jgi:hypothetical protein